MNLGIFQYHMKMPIGTARICKVLSSIALTLILILFYNHHVMLNVISPCDCLQYNQYGINNEMFTNVSMCSMASALKQKFHQKVISYSYYESNLPDPYHRHYFNGIEKNLLDIRNKFGPEWSMRLYIQMSMVSSTQIKDLCNLACTYPEVFEICDVEKNPRFGNISHIFPANWRFLTTLDSQVDIAFSHDLDSQFIHRELEAMREFLDSTKEFHFMRDHPHHNEDILAGMWGVKLTPAVRQKMDQSFEKMFDSNIFYEDPTIRGSDQELLKKYIWPWAKDLAMVHDSYHCNKYRNTVPFPTQRLDEDCNFVGCIPELKSRITFTKKNECPMKCRPKNHLDWKYC